MFFIVILFITGCGSSPTHDITKDADGDRIKVYTTFYPLYDFTKKIAKDRADVSMLVPAGVEPHDYEPSSKQMSEIYSQQLFIYLGEAMEPWGAKIADQLAQKGIATVELGKGLIKDNDPHLWLDPNLAREMAHRIYEALSEVDDANASFYSNNYEELSQKLIELDRFYADSLKDVTNRSIVTSHAAFGYMASRYKFNQISISGITPFHEPSPKKKAEQIEICKSNDIKYIFFEPLSSPKIAEALAKEIGAQTLVLDPIGSLTAEQIKSGEDYFSLMRKNLDNLVKAMN
ncbi:MAG: zinc ABC transporter solute-binding protein [Thermoanaerobacterales bacterium]|nr:zinc ABC transporter solute-binding protein [Thermoanaerobacterales bacterium]